MDQPTFQIAYCIVPIVTAMTALILLFAGGRLLKPAIGLCGGLLGAGAGILIAPELAISISPFVAALILGIIGVLLALFIAKFVILLTLGVAFAIVIPVITWHMAGFGDGAKIVDDVIAAATAPSEDPVQLEDTQLAITTQQAVSEALLIMTSDASDITRDGVARANAAWDVIPAGSRVLLAGSALAGLLLGLLIVTFMPHFASSLVTAALGSMLLVEAIGNGVSIVWPQYSISDISPLVLFLTISCIAIVGLIVQTTVGKKNKPQLVPQE